MNKLSLNFYEFGLVIFGLPALKDLEIVEMSLLNYVWLMKQKISEIYSYWQTLL